MALYDWIAIVVAFLSIGISIATLLYTINHDKSTDNHQSYFEPLNYHIEYLNGEENYEPTAMEHISGAVEIEPAQIQVIPETGGIHSVTLLYYYEGETRAIMPLTLMKNVDTSEHNAASLGYWIKEYTQYAMAEGPASERMKDSGCGKSYYSSIYVVVEDFDGDLHTAMTVFEYPIGKDGKITGEEDIREYDEMDLLYAYGKTSPLPDFDTKALSDYKQLKENLTDIFN